MTTEKRIGRQIPTTSVVLPYEITKGQEAVDLYNSTTRTAFEWQELIMSDILAVNDDGLWTHTKFGYAVPRRNGKNEVVVMREMWGLCNGEKILHSAHRTSTSSSAWDRLIHLLEEAGIHEIKGNNRTGYRSGKSKGQEFVEFSEEYGGGKIWFRTRSTTGGLGEGFDLLVIDEAQEYTTDQESALKYTVTDSDNPQTLFCGTPPTPVSSGTVFADMRKKILAGDSESFGWAEWSVEYKTDQNDVDAWYETNPSLGLKLTERAIRDEVGSDDIDFNVQRLGLWLKYNQKSAISKTEWEALKCDPIPKIQKDIFVGIKYGHDGQHVSLSVAVKTEDEKIFVEGIDCKPVRDGNAWIVEFIRKAKPKTIIIDGANGQNILAEELKAFKVKNVVLPTVKEIIVANATFEQAVFGRTLTHNEQPSLVQIASNCERRAIGSNGGFGYRSLIENVDVSLLDSVILAHWACANHREKKKQTVNY